MKCYKDMPAKTPYCGDFCDCVEWNWSEDTVHHLRRNFDISKDVLTYSSLDNLVDDPAILCVIGTCAQCGKQICAGSSLNEAKDLDALMRYLLSDHACFGNRSGTETNKYIVSLFREQDRNRVENWLASGCVSKE